MNKHVLESLNEYKDYKFFSALMEKEEKKKNDKQANPEDDKQAEEEKKDAEAILKKAQDNFARFKSAAGSKIQAYKSFWDHISAMNTKMQHYNTAIKNVYPLYDSDYAVIVFKEGEDAVPSLGVYKYNLEEDEENPIFTAKNPEVTSEFVEFLNKLKEEFKDVKDTYVRDVESKKKEEEREKKRKKFDSFLKESKRGGKKRNVLNEDILTGEDDMDEFFEDEFTPHGYLTLSNWGGIEIELSRDGDGVRYRYTDDDISKEAEIEYDDEGRPYFSDIGTEEDRRFYLDEFMKVNESQSKRKKKLNERNVLYNLTGEAYVYSDILNNISKKDYQKLNYWENSDRIYARRHINDFVISYDPGDKEVRDFLSTIEVQQETKKERKHKKLNEWTSSYDEFIDNYAEELGEIKRMFKEIQERMKTSSDEEIERVFTMLENRYDPPVVDFLDDYALTPNLPTMRSIADVGLEINNRYGTEMKMVINAVYDLYDEI